MMGNDPSFFLRNFYVIKVCSKLIKSIEVSMGVIKNIYKLGELTLLKKYKEQELEKHTLIDLFWECTLTCNAKCKHCGSSAEKKIYDGELTTEEIKEAFKQIASDMDAKKILINVL